MSQKVHLDIPGVDLRAETLAEAVAGRVPDIPPSAALSLLAGTDLAGVDRQRLLRDAVQDVELDPLVRAGSVRIYMLVAGTESVPALLRVLDDPAERVAASAATALGRVGTPDELDALRRQRTGDGGKFLRARATFAESLIIHRFGLSDRAVAHPPVDLLPAPPSAGALTFTGARPGLIRRDRMLKAIQREFPAFDAGKQDVYEVQCGPRLLGIAVDRDFTGPAGMRNLGSRPAAPAVVVMQNQEDDGFYPGLIALSDPAGKSGVSVRFSRLSGEAVYVADGSPRGTDLEFELRAVRAPGATPVAGRIRLTTSAIEISGSSGDRSTPGRTPQQG